MSSSSAFILENIFQIYQRIIVQDFNLSIAKVKQLKKFCFTWLCNIFKLAAVDSLPSAMVVITQKQLYLQTDCKDMQCWITITAAYNLIGNLNEDINSETITE